MSKLSFRSQVSLLVLFAASVVAAPAQTFTRLHVFLGPEGANPYVGLTQGRDGDFYGTTIDGGAYGSGNVFRMGPGGGVTSLYDFCAQALCPDGQYPDSVLALGNDGNFYGTTQNGGTNGGYGTVFKITRDGVLTVLHSFDAADGASPYGSLVLASDGAFYGTTNVGGTYGGGNVFKITPSGNLTTLYTFCSQGGCSDGQYSVGSLIQASDGNIYGTTHAGGNTSCTDGCGTIFRITLGGNFATLYRFDTTDGEYPYGGVVEGSDGALYGTTGGGGTGGFGTVFRFDGGSKLTTLHSFQGSDGATPYALMSANDGNLYGTTSTGGSRSRGTIFEITTADAFTTLHNFTGPDGALIYAGLLQATSGAFYGTAYFGGHADDGNVFSLNNGLGPFVTFVVPAGKVGQTGGILGQGLTGTSSVSINGLQAAFHVVSDTYLTVTVPAGANTGFVTVITPNAVLTSNVQFRVIQ